jgi:hypothetical protein
MTQIRGDFGMTDASPGKKQVTPGEEFHGRGKKKQLETAHRRISFTR